MLDISSVNQILGILDMPLMIAVAIISIVIARFTADKYDILVPLVLGAASGFIAESQTPTFGILMALRRSFLYGAGGFILYYIWRDRVTGWIDGNDRPEVTTEITKETNSEKGIN